MALVNNLSLPRTLIPPLLSSLGLHFHYMGGHKDLNTTLSLRSNILQWMEAVPFLDLLKYHHQHSRSSLHYYHQGEQGQPCPAGATDFNLHFHLMGGSKGLNNVSEEHTTPTIVIPWGRLPLSSIEAEDAPPIPPSTKTHRLAKNTK